MHKLLDFQRFTNITQTLDFQRFYGAGWVKGRVLSKDKVAWFGVWFSEVRVLSKVLSKVWCLVWC